MWLKTTCKAKLRCKENVIIFKKGFTIRVNLGQFSPLYHLYSGPTNFMPSYVRRVVKSTLWSLQWRNILHYKVKSQKKTKVLILLEYKRITLSSWPTDHYILRDYVMLSSNKFVWIQKKLESLKQKYTGTSTCLGSFVRIILKMKER